MENEEKLYWSGNHLVLRETGQIVGDIMAMMCGKFLASPYEVRPGISTKSTMWETSEAAKAGLLKQMSESLG